MDSFGRLPNDVIHMIQTMYHKPLMEVIVIDNHIYLRFKYPHFELEFQMNCLLASLSMNDRFVINLVKMICNKSGNYSDLNTTITIDNDIIITSGVVKLVLSIDNLNTFIDMLIQYYKMIIIKNKLDVHYYDIKNKLFKVQGFNYIIDAGDSLINSTNVFGNLINPLPSDIKIHQFMTNILQQK